MFTIQAANCTFIHNKSTNPENSQNPQNPQNPQPTNPQPTNPQPTNLQPTNPQPTNPQPTNPQPTNPQPTNPQPTNQQSNPQSSNSLSTNSDETTYPHTLLATVLAISENEPKTFKQVTSCTNASRWYTAMQEELDLMKEQDIWTVIPILSPKHNIVDCRWVYKIKRDFASQIKQHKARLVAKGFSQQPGTDFDKIVSPVVRYDSIRKKYILSQERQTPETPVTCSASRGRPHPHTCLPEYPVRTLVSYHLSQKPVSVRHGLFPVS